MIMYTLIITFKKRSYHVLKALQIKIMVMYSINMDPTLFHGMKQGMDDKIWTTMNQCWSYGWQKCLHSKCFHDTVNQEMGHTIWEV